MIRVVWTAVALTARLPPVGSCGQCTTQPILKSGVSQKKIKNKKIFKIKQFGQSGVSQKNNTKYLTQAVLKSGVSQKN